MSTISDRRDFAQAVANELAALPAVGGAWRATVHPDNGDCWYVQGPEFTFRLRFERGRIELSGSGEPNLRNYVTQVPRISVDPGRGAITVAREIARRLLPAWRPILTEARQRKAVQDAADRERDQLRDMLRAILAPGRPPGDREPYSYMVSVHHEGRFSGRAEVRYGETYFEIHVRNPDVARRLAVFLAGGGELPS